MIDAGRANIGIMRDDKGDFLAYALRPIRKGEEVRLSPQHGCGNEGSNSISFNHLSRLLEWWTILCWSYSIRQRRTAGESITITMHAEK